MSPRSRLDVALVRRGFARSRGQAREMITAGTVRVRGAAVTKPAHPVTDADPVTLSEEPGHWVGRAAYKLLAALEEFGASGLDPRDRRCLDVGASTGGFTQVLLAHGAAHVVALDVGHDQLAAPVASDPRVTERSGVNVRDVVVEEIGGPFELVVADLSFISLRTVLSTLARLTAAEGHLVALVKPQFEVGRERLGRSGVVKSADQRRRALLDVIAVARPEGLVPRGLCRSPITGGSGNREYLLWLGRTEEGMMSEPEMTLRVDTLTQEDQP
jgi:23S rRNA (cytidine1920-2'-O)/16S rRNA (cytidine1409-2'-O)-methyltransferase